MDYNYIFDDSEVVPVSKMVNSRLLVLVQTPNQEIVSDCDVVLHTADGEREVEYDADLKRYVATDLESGTYRLEIRGGDEYNDDERTVEITSGDTFVRSTLRPQDDSDELLSYVGAGGEKAYFRPDRSKRFLYAHGPDARKALSEALDSIDTDFQSHDLADGDDEQSSVGPLDSSDEALVEVELPEEDSERSRLLSSLDDVSIQPQTEGGDSAASRSKVRVIAPVYYGAGDDDTDDQVSGLTDEIIVQFDAGVDENRVTELAAEFGCQVLNQVGYGENGYLWRQPFGDDPYEILDTIEELLDRAEVVSAEPNIAFRIEYHGTSANDFLLAEQTHLPLVEAGGAWAELESIEADLRYGSPDVTIAIMDSGVDPTHPDLTGPLTDGSEKLVASYDFVRGEPQDPTQLDPANGGGHGTQSASSATARTGNGLGVAGVAGNCKLIGARILGLSTVNGLANTLLWAAGLPTGDPTLPPAPTHPADVVSNSWGPASELPVLPAAFDALFDTLTQNGRNGRGCVVVFAAGNYGYEQFAPLNAIGSDQRVISVGASIDANPTDPVTSIHEDPDGNRENLPAVVDTRTYFSPYGPEMDIVAPSHTSYSLNETGDDGNPLLIDAITAATPVEWGDWIGDTVATTTLASGASSGDTTVSVVDGSGFTAGEYALIGTVGSSEHEFVRITGTAGNDLSVTELAESYPAGMAVATGPNDYSGSEGLVNPARVNGFGGTSHSCPTVAGAACLVLSIRPELTWEEVRDILRESADTIDAGQAHPEGVWTDNDGDGLVDFSQWYGFGRLNAEAAVNRTKASALSITLDTPNLVFEVPEGMTTVRPVEFSVRSFESLTFEVDLPIPVTNGPGSFSSPYGTTVTIPATDGATQTRYVWISHTGTTSGDVTEGEVTVRYPGLPRAWPVPITATTIRRESAAVDLVLDKSGSMRRDSGVRTPGGSEITRVDVLKYSAPVLVDLLRDDDGIGVVSFDSEAYPVSDLQAAGPSLVGQGRLEAKNGIRNISPDGSTSVGDGVFLADSRLDGIPPMEYDSKSIVALTDGKENAPRYIADILGAVDAKRVFAIGLGTQEHLNQGALEDLTNPNNGYLMMTGNLESDDYFRLMKYYVQILAGVKNEDIVTDPEGHLRPGQEHRVPFELSDTDISTDVMVLAPGSDIFDIRLETPTGSVVHPRTVNSLTDASYVVGDNISYYRIPLPLVVDEREAHAGTWHAVLGINREGYSRYLNDIEENDPRGYRAVETHGVRYSCSVNTFSNLRMRTTLSQTKRTPGAQMTVRAVLREYDRLPVENRATVRANLTYPDGTRTVLPLSEVDPGVFEASITANATGLYRFTVNAEGDTLRGHRFTREWELTGSVWHRGDDPYPSAKTDPNVGREQLCETLLCLIEGFEEYFEEREVDVEHLRECLEEYCEGQRAPVDEGAEFDSTSGLQQSDMDDLSGILGDPAVVNALRTLVQKMDVD